MEIHVASEEVTAHITKVGVIVAATALTVHQQQECLTQQQESHSTTARWQCDLQDALFLVKSNIFDLQQQIQRLQQEGHGD